MGSSCVDACVLVQDSPIVVIATHPWGPMGGNMNDRHPSTALDIMSRAGCSTARFNFRSGIGRGSGSVEDVKAVAKWFTEPRDGPPLANEVLIIGYSYGSMVGAAAASEIPKCIGYAMICPPLGYGWALFLFNAGTLQDMAAVNMEGKPKLIMLGTNDEFCSIPAMQTFANTLPDPTTVEVHEGVDHFSMYSKLESSLTKWITTAFAKSSLQAFAKGTTHVG